MKPEPAYKILNHSPFKFGNINFKSSSWATFSAPSSVRKHPALTPTHSFGICVGAPPLGQNNERDFHFHKKQTVTGRKSGELQSRSFMMNNCSHVVRTNRPMAGW